MLGLAWLELCVWGRVWLFPGRFGFSRPTFSAVRADGDVAGEAVGRVKQRFGRSVLGWVGPSRGGSGLVVVGLGWVAVGGRSGRAQRF